MGEGNLCCAWRRGGEGEGKIVLTVGLSLQNMSITQEPLWIPDVKCDEQR